MTLTQRLQLVVTDLGSEEEPELFEILSAALAALELERERQGGV